MKKLITTMLALALALNLVPLANIQSVDAAKGGKAGQEDKADKGGQEDKGGKEENGNGWGKDKPAKDAEPGIDDSTGTEEQTDVDTPGDDTADDNQGTIEDGTGDGTGEEPTPDAEQPAVGGKGKGKKESVVLKKELIELRQELKKAAEITPELEAKYAELTEELVNASALGEALEVQKELLDRVYKPGDLSQFETLGELYEQAGDESLKTFVNGEEVVAEEEPFIVKGRAFVPVRAISRALKAEVNWDPETKTVEIVRGESTITLYLDKNEAVVNGQTVTLDTAPVIRNGRTFLPLRFIGEALKAKVAYQDEGNIVIIEDPQAEEETQPEESTPVETTPVETTPAEGTEQGSTDGTQPAETTEGDTTVPTDTPAAETTPTEGTTSEPTTDTTGANS